MTIKKGSICTKIISFSNKMLEIILIIYFPVLFIHKKMILIVDKNHKIYLWIIRVIISCYKETSMKPNIGETRYYCCIQLRVVNNHYLIKSFKMFLIN